MSPSALSKKFKYHIEHGKLSCGCPNISKLNVFNGTAYRWVHKNTKHFNCSHPNMVISPKRKYKSCEETCGGFALSFFRSFDQAKASLEFVYGGFPAIKGIVGDHVAECILSSDDGLAEKADMYGHFNFHEFENTSFKKRLVNPLIALK